MVGIDNFSREDFTIDFSEAIILSFPFELIVTIMVIVIEQGLGEWSGTAVAYLSVAAVAKAVGLLGFARAPAPP